MQKYRIIVDLKPQHSFSYQWRIELITEDGVYTVANGQAHLAVHALANAEYKARELGLV